MKRLAVIILISVFATQAQAKLIGKNVEYMSGDTIMKGYLAYDDRFKGKRPGVLVVHEWWGHNDYARTRARMLAKLGYIAFSLDMYGKGKLANHPKDAGQFSGAVKKDMKVARARFLAALEQLNKQPFTDTDKTAAIGYCFGGGIVLEMARLGVDLDAVVSFHGSLGTTSPATKGSVSAKILVLNGEADPFVKPEQIAAFKTEMEQAGVAYKFINYPNARHAFTNPAATKLGRKFKIPIEYNKEADKASWREMKQFFQDVFK